MAAVGASYVTLADVAKQKEPNGSAAQIIEMLAQISSVVKDGLAIECNNGTKHVTTVRDGIPAPTWRRLYEGITPGKGTMNQVEDATGNLQSRSQVDVKLLEYAGDTAAAVRLNEAAAHLEGMAQEAEATFFYGDPSTAPAKFTGLAPRFNSSTAQNGSQIIKGGGAGNDNTSIWLLSWGPMATHLLFPKGTKAGIQRKDLGELDAYDANNKPYRAKAELFDLDIGLSCRDWRYVARVCNIDTTQLTVDGSAGADIIKLMTTAYYRHRGRKMINGKTMWYCNTTVKEYLHHQAQNKANVNLRLDQSSGEEVLKMHGFPIIESEAILNTEATVV